MSLNNPDIKIGNSYKENNAWNNLINNNYDFSITENVMTDESSSPYMILYSGIKDNQGKTIGVFAVSIKWNLFNKNNFENVSNIGKSSRLFLINDYDKLIAHKRFLQELERK